MICAQTKRQILWLPFALVVAIAAAVATPRVVPWLSRGEHVGSGNAYAILGNLPVQHRGRVKPLSSMAIEEVKLIHGRSTVTLPGPDKRSTMDWEPVAAVLDWSARPEFWDNQDLIQLARPQLSRPLRAGEASVTEGSLEALAARDQERLSPRVLDGLRLRHGGHTDTLLGWVGEILDKRGEARPSEGPIASRPTPVEERTIALGERLLHYRAIREHRSPAIKPLDLLVVPRPSNESYRSYTTEVFERGMKPDQTLSSLETDVANTLVEYLESIPSKDWALPGEDAIFDQKFTLWLISNATWIPLGVILESDASDLSRAGLPLELVVEFRKAYREFEDAERAAPGNAPEAGALAMIVAARKLGASLGDYPRAVRMERESRLNRIAPFSRAPLAYGLALLLLSSSLWVTAHPGPKAKKLGVALHGLGIFGLTCGIALELYGFLLRFLCSRWGPVTHMYETVVWVAMAASVLGLVLELLWRNRYPALAASSIALLATLVAENVSLLDPTIRVVPPELRINRWLMGHVLTIVSSYAAFALALALGLLAVGYYLTASYRRSPSFRELARPLWPGIPLYVLGRLEIDPLSRLLPLPVLDLRVRHPIIVGLAAIGGVLTIVGGLSLMGELANRSPRQTCLLGLTLAAFVALGLIAGTAGAVQVPLASALTSYDAWIVGLVAAALIVMSLLGTRARDASARIRSLADIIDRVMQVGVLLLGIGIIVGGAWARSSWGRFWGWEPKEVWALATLLAYLVPVLGRSARRVNTFGLVAASVVCSLAVLMSWYGVNFVLRVGAHSYGFTEGGDPSIVLACALSLLAIVGAAAWRRFCSNHDQGSIIVMTQP